MRFLLTNDDSHASPLLPVTAEKLARLGPLEIIVPEREHSWCGKAISRKGTLPWRRLEVSGLEVLALDGTPSDCVNIAVHHLCAAKPDLVVAGINIGQNAGLSYLLSSGTVGAGLEANICGVPAVAFSQALSPELFAVYRSAGKLPDEFVEFVRSRTAGLLELLLGVFVEKHLLHRDVVWNVNFPWEFATWPPPLRVCTVGETLYGSLFSAAGPAFVHDPRQERRDQNPDCDSVLLNSGQITITPLSLKAFGRLDSEYCRDLQELFAAAYGRAPVSSGDGL